MTEPENSSQPQAQVSRPPAATVSSSPNPYVLVVLTATLSAVLSVGGGYFTSAFQAQHAIAQKQLELRSQAYGAFLDKIDYRRSPVINEILSVGKMVDSLGTDSEIQGFENHLAGLLTKLDKQRLLWQFKSDLNILRIHGSKRVLEITDDILAAMALHSDEIEWKTYPPELAAFYERWRSVQQNGVPYGWEPRVSSEQRLMIAVIAELTEVLLNQLRVEVQTA